MIGCPSCRSILEQGLGVWPGYEWQEDEMTDMKQPDALHVVGVDLAKRTFAVCVATRTKPLARQGVCCRRLTLI